MSRVFLNNNAINQKGTPLLYTDIFSNRPQYGINGRLFFSTDSQQIFEDTGTSWLLLANATGSLSGYVPYTGANLTVNLNTQSLISGAATFSDITKSNAGIIATGTVGGNGTGRTDAQIEINNFSGGHTLFSLYNNLAADESAISFGAILSNATVYQSGAIFTRYVNGVNLFSSYQTVHGYHAVDSAGDFVTSLQFSNNSVVLLAGATATLPFNTLPAPNTVNIGGSIGGKVIINRLGGQPTIIGISDLVLDGSATNGILYLQAYSTGNTLISQNASSNVGIGTSTVGSKLQINGNAAIGYNASQAAPTNGLVVAGISGFGTASPNANYNLTVVRPVGGSGNVWMEGNSGTTGLPRITWNNAANSSQFLMQMNTALGGVSFTGSITAASGIGQAMVFNNTIVAAANNDILSGVYINPVFTNGAFSGVTNFALNVSDVTNTYGLSTTGETVAASATLSRQVYHVFTGGAGQTLTLNSPVSNNLQYIIINNTANPVTIAASGATNIITLLNVSSPTITLAANARTYLIADGINKYYQII